MVKNKAGFGIAQVPGLASFDLYLGRSSQTWDRRGPRRATRPNGARRHVARKRDSIKERGSAIPTRNRDNRPGFRKRVFQMAKNIRVLVVGCGHMGRSHARAYHKLDGFEVVGLVSRGDGSREKLAADLGGKVAQFGDFETALRETRPDAVSINTYPDTHAEYAIKSLEAGAHVFLEKPVAETVADAEKVINLAKKLGKKLVVGYILHHHPAYAKFVEVGKTLGKPMVMRMNLNQQSFGPEWETHKNLMSSISPIVDCGVHYVDLMCQVTGSKPKSVHCIGARLTEEIDKDMYNYGQLQIKFEDGSVGWYEAGWGPMMSKTGYFIKDMIGPGGCVSIVGRGKRDDDSADVDGHTKTNSLLVHRSKLDANNQFVEPDQIIDMADEPGHQDLCDREQAFFLKAINTDMDLTNHLRSALDSLRIVLAADESWRTGKIISL
jgi:predicted dehydrogenase